MRYQIYDMHTHTNCSHDGRQTMEELCRAQILAGSKGFAVTNHSDTPFSHENGDFDRLERSLREGEMAKKKFGDQVEILLGVEIGEALWAKENTDMILSLGEWDVILGSVHGQLENGQCVYYGGDPYDTWQQNKLDTYLRRYLEDLADTAANADYDVLAHLDCPIRYISGKCHREADIMHYQDLVDEVLKAVIARDKTLEINGSGLNSGWGQTMPRIEVLERYRELGGTRICLGSDAHTAENAGKNLNVMVEQLLRAGFAKQTVYRRRCPVEMAFLCE